MVMEFGPDRDRKVQASKKSATPAGEALDGGSAPRGRAPVELPAPGAPKHPWGDGRALVPGARVRVVECSGVDSRKEGVIVLNSHASEINQQPPGKPSWGENPYGTVYGERGRYKPFDPKREAIIRGDDGKLFTMFKDRLQIIPADGGPGSGAEAPFIPPHARTSPEAIEIARQAHDLAVQATDLHGKLRMQTINAFVETQKADTKELHSDAAYLHDQLSEAHRKMATTFQHLPSMAHVHETLAGLHLSVKEAHRRAMGLARPEEFNTPEGTDAYYNRNYGETHPAARRDTDKMIAGTHRVESGVLVEKAVAEPSPLDMERTILGIPFVVDRRNTPIPGYSINAVPHWVVLPYGEEPDPKRYMHKNTRPEVWNELERYAQVNPEMFKKCFGKG